MPAIPFDVDALPVAWREATQDGGANCSVVLLLHGLGGSRLSWEPQLSVLAADHRVIAWDVPGYGQSSPLETVTFAALAAAAADLLGRLGSGPAHVVGISFGGMIAQYLAALHPHTVRSLTLLATSPAFGLDGTDPVDWQRARLGPLDQGQQPADFAQAVLRSLAGADIDERVLGGQVAAMSRVPAEGLRAMISCLVTHDSRLLLGSIVAPTLVVVGELDHETPVDYSFALADAIAGARLVVVPDVGHLLNAEAADEINSLITDHIRRTEPA